MRLVVWNAKVGRNHRGVVRATRRLLRNTEADALALLEATAYVGALRDGLPNWRVQHPLGSDVVLLTRITSIRPEVDVIEHDLPWVGPKVGIHHEGRGHLLVDGRILIVHRLTGGPEGPNADAFDAESDLIHDTLHGLERALCVGDQNATTGELAAWWRAQGMTPVRTTAKVDHGAERGLIVVARKLRRYYGSDHTPVLYRVH